jgi:CreA protein
MKYAYAIIFAVLLLLTGPAFAQERDIGSVSTGFKLIGPNHKIIITAFDDPSVKGVTCYVARPKTGGLKGAVGLAEDPSLASVSCAQTGPIRFTDKIEADENGEEVFDESRSLIFKSLKINRIYDKANGSLVYVVRTKRIIEGSPTTSLSVIAPMSWNGIAPQKPELD